MLTYPGLINPWLINRGVSPFNGHLSFLEVTPPQKLARVYFSAGGLWIAAPDLLGLLRFLPVARCALLHKLGQKLREVVACGGPRLAGV